MFEYYSDLKIKYGFTIYTAGRVRGRKFFLGYSGVGLGKDNFFFTLGCLRQR